MRTILQAEFWYVQYLNNALWEYLLFLIFFIGISAVIFLLKYILLRKIARIIKERPIFNLFLEVINRIRSPFYAFVSFYISLSILDIPEYLSKIFWIVLVFLVMYRVVMIGYQFIDFGLRFYLKSKDDDKEDTAMIRNIGNVGKGILWIFAGIIILSIFGVDVTALVAGMGIGGIAIAFALQSILSDLFSSFSIFLDKPFKEGDFISVGEKMGTVEKIGIKSTRIRALQGEEIIFSNKELTTTQVHNLGNMERRRASFSLGIAYETPIKKMKKVPDIVKKIVEKEDNVQLSSINFRDFGESSLDFLLVYFVESPDWQEFLNTNEKILFNLKEKFDKEGIEFAYPTRTLHVFSHEDK